MATENPRDQDTGRAAGDAFDFRGDLATQRAMLLRRLADAKQAPAAQMSRDAQLGLAAFAGYTLGPMLMARRAKRRRRRQTDA